MPLTFVLEARGIADVPGVDAEAAQADGAEVLVADGDGLGGAPALVDLLRGEKK